MAQSEVIGQKPEVLQKNRGVTKNQHFCIFGPIALKQIELGVLVSEPMFFRFKAITKNKEVLIFCYTEFASRQSRNEGQFWPPVTRP